MTDETVNEVASVRRIDIAGDEQELLVTKMRALHKYRAAQSELTEINLKLLERGFTPNLGGIMSW